MSADVSLQDQPEVDDAAQLLRRITRDWMVPDGRGGLRLSRQAFQDLTAEDGTEAMSVYVEGRLEELGLTAQHVLDGHPGYGLAALPASAARACGLDVVWAPEPADAPRGLAHAHVLGKKTGSRQRALANASEIRVEPA